MPTVAMEVKKTVGTFDAAGQTGAAVDVLQWDAPKSAQFAGMQVGTFTDCTLQLQGSNDNQNWVAVGTTVTTNSIVTFEGCYAWLRVLTGAHGGTSNPSVTLAGHRHPAG